MPQTADIEFRVLGPIEVSAGDRLLAPAEPRQRAVLAALVVDAGRTVPVERLIDRVWGEDPPREARRALHAHLSRVRRLLDQLPAGGGPADVALVRDSGGYRLAIAPERVDLQRFRALAARARDGALPPAERAALLRGALTLWRGEPLSGLRGTWAESRRQLWARERVTAVLAWAAAEADAGHVEAPLGPLAELTSELPLAEPAAAALMRALAATGRPADALAEFARVRRDLREELGLEPGPELQAVQLEVLRGDVPPQRPAAPVSRPGGQRRPVPEQLPADVVPFTGRDAELAALDRLRGARTDDGATAVVAVAGTAGVGKTALAVRWAHRLREEFPDGRLYVNLRGYAQERPMTAEEALEELLGVLLPPGVPMPGGLAERAARFRSELAGRRVLLLLDNAATVEQVRPLLPGGSGCLVVVTSRDSLPGLVARDGARRLDLDLLDEEAATALLHRLVGDRAAADPAMTAALATLCARLPLALRVAAERAVARPGAPLADLVAGLADERRRLDLLAAGDDQGTAIRCVFSWSVRQLHPRAALLFRHFGRHPGPDLDIYSAAALLGDPDGVSDGAAAGTADALDTLDALGRAHLVRATGEGRYDLHDLLRAYARDLAETSGAAEADGAPAAMTRLLDHYLAAAARAMDQVYPAEKHRRPAAPSPATPRPRLGTTAEALAWLEAERANLLAAGVYAAASGRPGHARDLSATLQRFLDGRHHTDALRLHEAALRAARHGADPVAEALACNAVGGAHIQSGRHEAATEHLTRALELFTAAGDVTGQGRALANLGTVHERLAELPVAARRYLAALDLFVRTGDEAAEAHVLTRLGAVERRLGRHAQATEHLTRALVLHRRTGHRSGEAWALSGLGEVEVDAGRTERAAARLGRARALFRDLGDLAGEAWVLVGLGAAELVAGRPGAATAHHELAHQIFVDLGERTGQAWALNGLGEAVLAGGTPRAAAGHHEAALTVAIETGARDQEARARTGLTAARATATRASGRSGQAPNGSPGSPVSATSPAPLASTG